MEDRPIGVTILAVLHLLGGAGMLCVIPMMLSVDQQQAAEALDPLGASMGMMIASALLLMGLNLATGIGLFSRAPWGWRLGTFFCVFTIARSLNAMFTLAELQGDFILPGDRLELQFIKFGGRIVINGLLLMYYFRENVLDWFGLRHVHMGRELGQHVAVVMAMFGITTLVAWLF